MGSNYSCNKTLLLGPKLLRRRLTHLIFLFGSLLIILKCNPSSNSIDTRAAVPVYGPDGSSLAANADAAVAPAAAAMALSLQNWPPGNQYSIIIPSYNRTDVLESLLTHFNSSSCFSLKEIFVNWANASAELPDFLVDGRFNRYPVKVTLPRTFSIEQRFVLPEDLDTEAVLQLDDDLRLACDELEFGFEVFKQFPEKIAGFVARGHYKDTETNTWKYTDTFDAYSLILTGAAFLHRRWFENFFNPTIMPLPVLEYIREHKNCEDIAMNFLVAHTTRKPPIFINGIVHVIRVPGIHDSKGHYNVRDTCLNKFADLYGYMPLENARSYIKAAYDMRSQLLTYEDPKLQSTSSIDK